MRSLFRLDAVDVGLNATWDAQALQRVVGAASCRAAVRGSAFKLAVDVT